MSAYGAIQLRRGLAEQVPQAGLKLGEIAYLTDKEVLCVGNGKGGTSVLLQVIKGPNDALYGEVEGIEGYVPLIIRGS